jgi:hypothetical protein
MTTQIQLRFLTHEETEKLEAEVKKSPHIGFIGKKMWQKFGKCYVITMNDEFAGICAAVHLPHWIKMGPLVVLGKFQGKGLAKQLVNKILSENENKNLYIGSSNPYVIQIVEKLNFQKEGNFFKLPAELQRYQVNYLLDRLSLKFLMDAITKNINQKKSKYYYFMRFAHL